MEITVTPDVRVFGRKEESVTVPSRGDSDNGWKVKKGDREKGTWDTLQSGRRGRGANARLPPGDGQWARYLGPRSHHLDNAPLHGGDRGSPGGAAALRGGGHVQRWKNSE